VIWRGPLDSSSVRGRTVETVLCGSWWVCGHSPSGIWLGVGLGKRASSVLSDLSSSGGREGVDDVEGPAKAEILINDELDGLGSRDGGVCL
jgi:hypothetical protein